LERGFAFSGKELNFRQNLLCNGQRQAAGRYRTSYLYAIVCARLYGGGNFEVEEIILGACRSQEEGKAGSAVVWRVWPVYEVNVIGINSGFVSIPGKHVISSCA
jgi:hypothetical protein